MWNDTDQTNKTRTVKIKINKATLPSFTPQWNYKVGSWPVYDGAEKTLQLTGLPSQIKVTYGGTYRGTDPNTYNATAAFTVDPNYETPSILSSYASYSWTIEKAELTGIEWKTDSSASNSGKFLPKIDNSSVEVKYYKTYNGGVLSDPVTASDIETEYQANLGKTLTYYAEATVSATDSGLGAPNKYYKLPDSFTDNPHTFTVGENKTLVIATTSDTGKVYDKTSASVTFTVSTNPNTPSITQSSLDVTWYNYDASAPNNKGTALSAAPTDAGKYVIEISLKSGVDALLSGTKIFTYEITPAKIDVSSVKWNYDGTWQYGVDDSGNVLKYKAELENLPEELKATYGAVTSEQTEVNKYRTTVTIGYGDGIKGSNYQTLSSLEYSAEFQTSLDWEIKVRNIQKPKSAGEVTYSGEAIDLFAKFGADYADLNKYYTVSATYGNGTDTVSLSLSEGKYVTENVGEYKIVFSLKSEHGANVTWEDGNTGVITTTLTLKPFEIDVTGWSGAKPPRPQFSNDYVSTDYYETETREVSTGDIATPPLKPSTQFRTEIKIKEPYKTNGNVIFSAASTPNLSKTFISGSAHDAPPTQIEKPYFDPAILQYNKQEQTFTLTGYDSRYMEIAVAISDSLTQKEVKKYSVTILILNDAVNNYSWKDGSETGSLDPLVLEFEITKRAVTLPTVDKTALVYTGAEQTYEPTGFDTEWMSVTGNQGLNADTYTMTLTLTDKDNTYWVLPEQTTQKMSVKLADEAEITADQDLEWRINKFKLEWSDQGGVPKLEIPTAYKDLVEVTYKYYDEEGNEVAEENLQKGVQYKVRAELPSEYANNFGIEEAMLDYDENEFVINGGFVDFIKENWWIWIVLGVLLLLLLLFFIIRSHKKKAKVQEIGKEELAADTDSQKTPEQEVTKPTEPQPQADSTAAAQSAPNAQP
ncbi:MAG: hypothetical protein NC114_12080, partial [Ruminococcus flavefaciens]|nr:hypothetical protein [Ruminococcus flavefaciens]